MQSINYRGFVIVILLYGVILAQGSAKPQPCSRALSIPLTEASQLENGTFYFNNQWFPPELVWRDGDDVFGCPCGLPGACLRTCCDSGELLNGRNCIVSTNFTVEPIRLENENLAPELQWIKSLEDAFYTIPNSICPTDQKYLLEPESYASDEYVLHTNGTLITQSQIFQQENYCIASLLADQSIAIVICYDDIKSMPEVPPDPLYPIGMIISIPFLLATAVTYAIIPELHNLYGKTLMCYVSSLANAYIFLTVIQMDNATESKLSLLICIILGNLTKLQLFLFSIIIINDLILY